MNYIRHLTGFYELIQEDHRLNPTHISLYLALFQSWNLNRFRNPISISRGEMMRLSKISALGTYHKCIKQLQEFGYIEYLPSFNPYKGSMVNLLNLENQTVQNNNIRRTEKQTAAEQVANGRSIKIHSGNRQALIPSINSTNHTNNKHRERPTQKSSVMASEAKQSQTPVQKFQPPTLSEVKLLFEEKEAPEEEAEKFFNHYESNGWLVGGKSKMKDWHAAARNWLLNAKKFNTVTQNLSNNPKPNHLNATTQKDYTEPL